MLQFTPRMLHCHMNCKHPSCRISLHHAPVSPYYDNSTGGCSSLAHCMLSMMSYLLHNSCDNFLGCFCWHRPVCPGNPWVNSIPLGRQWSACTHREAIWPWTHIVHCICGAWEATSLMLNATSTSSCISSCRRSVQLVHILASHVGFSIIQCGYLIAATHAWISGVVTW